MSWHYSQELAEDFSVDSYLVGLRSARWKLNHTHAMLCSPDSVMDCSRHSRCGMTSEPSTANHGGASSISSLEASPAKISAQPGTEQGSTEKIADSGEKCSVSFAKFDQATHSWRIHPALFIEDSPLCLETWPTLGMMRHGVCSELLTSEHRTDATAFGYSGRLLPTPMVNDAKNNGGPGQQRRHAPQLGAIVGGAPNPPWVEWLLGWPTGWTDLKPLATDKYRPFSCS